MAEGRIARNIAVVRERISQSCERAGRSAESVTLVAVSKNVPAKSILAASEVDVGDFGESYVQEGNAKICDPIFAHSGIRWHFIGHIQSNKVRQIVGKFELIHSVDSVALAAEIGRRSALQDIHSRLLLEVRLDTESLKHGFLPADLDEAVERVVHLPGVELLGLMGMPPFSERAEESRPHFRGLKALFDRLPKSCREILSMGMSGDFEVAIEEGATHVRVGTAIFGSR